MDEELDRVARAIYLADSMATEEEDGKLWDEGRVDIAQRNAYLSMAEAARKALGPWEYYPGHIGSTGRVFRGGAGGTIAPGFVAQFMAEGGEVIRRRVGIYGTVTPDTAPPAGGRELMSEAGGVTSSPRPDVHPSHEMYWFGPSAYPGEDERGECENCGFCSCCDSWTTPCPAAGGGDDEQETGLAERAV